MKGVKGELPGHRLKWRSVSVQRDDGTLFLSGTLNARNAINIGSDLALLTPCHENTTAE